MVPPLSGTGTVLAPSVSLTEDTSTFLSSYWAIGAVVAVSCADAFTINAKTNKATIEITFFMILFLIFNFCF
jgi:hypothetical protein